LRRKIFLRRFGRTIIPFRCFINGNLRRVEVRNADRVLPAKERALVELRGNVFAGGSALAAIAGIPRWARDTLPRIAPVKEEAQVTIGVLRVALRSFLTGDFSIVELGALRLLTTLVATTCLQLRHPSPSRLLKGRHARHARGNIHRSGISVTN